MISIIGIISTIAITSITGAREKAKKARAQAEVKGLYQALMRYNFDNNNTWPAACNNFDVAAEWNGAWNIYYRDVTTDPWGNVYFFDGCPNIECTSGGSSVCSAGANGVFESHNMADRRVRGDDICIYFAPEC